MIWFRAKTLRTLTLSVLGVCSSVTMLLSASQAQTSVPKQVAGTNISIGKDHYLFGNLDIFNAFNIF